MVVIIFCRLLTALFFADPWRKFLKTVKICSLVFVVLKSVEDVPSLFFTPSIRKPSVAVEDIVSLQTIYLKKNANLC